MRDFLSALSEQLCEPMLKRANCSSLRAIAAHVVIGFIVVAIPVAVVSAPQFLSLAGLDKWRWYLSPNFYFASENRKLTMISEEFKSRRFLSILDAVKKNSPRDSKWLIFRTSEFAYYGERRFIDHMNPTMLPFYEMKRPKRALDKLAQLGIDFIFVPYRHPPTLYNSVFGKIISDPSLSTLLETVNSYQIYRINKKARYFETRPILRTRLTGETGSDRDLALDLANIGGRNWTTIGEDISCQLHANPTERFSLRPESDLAVSVGLSGAGRATARMFSVNNSTGEITKDVPFFVGPLGDRRVTIRSTFDVADDEASHYLRLAISPNSRIRVEDLEVASVKLAEGKLPVDWHDLHQSNGLKIDGQLIAPNSMHRRALFGNARPRTHPTYLDKKLQLLRGSRATGELSFVVDGTVHPTLLYFDKLGTLTRKQHLDALTSSSGLQQTSKWALQKEKFDRSVALRLTLEPGARISVQSFKVIHSNVVNIGESIRRFWSSDHVPRIQTLVDESTELATIENPTTDRYRELYLGSLGHIRVLQNEKFPVLAGKLQRLRMAIKGNGRVSVRAIFLDKQDRQIGGQRLWRSSLDGEKRYVQLFYEALPAAAAVYFEVSSARSLPEVSDIRHDELEATSNVELEQLYADKDLNVLEKVDKLALVNKARRQIANPEEMVWDFIYVGQDVACTITGRRQIAYSLKADQTYRISGHISGDGYISVYGRSFDARGLPTAKKTIVWSGVIQNSERDFIVQYRPPKHSDYTIFSYMLHEGTKMRLTEFEIEQVKYTKKIRNADVAPK